MTLELLDPNDIIVRNICRRPPTRKLLDSVRAKGVKSPIGVLRTPEGELHLRFGGRRRLASIAAGRKVPAVVVEGTAGTAEDEIDRIFEQLDENDSREDLTPAERIAAVQELFDFGATVARVKKETGLDKAEIEAARKAAKSSTARTLAAQYPVTLDQAAVLAEFDDVPEIAAGLAETARDNPAQFAYAAQLARDERAEAVMLAARAAELTEQGYTVSSERLHYENMITYWAGKDGAQLTPENHKDCPGSTVALQAYGYGDSRRVGETWYCTDPKDHGHKKFHSGQPEKDPEEAAAERKQVRESNTAWRAATTVRQQWIRDVLLARKDLPAGAALFTARAIAGAENHMINALTTMGGGRHKSARELLGGIEKDTYDYKTQATTSPLVDSLTGISEQRAHMITLALVLGAYEDQAADTETWRRPTPASREYLAALARWGHTLSPIEQTVADAAGSTTTEAAG